MPQYEWPLSRQSVKTIYTVEEREPVLSELKISDFRLLAASDTVSFSK